MYKLSSTTQHIQKCFLLSFPHFFVFPGVSDYIIRGSLKYLRFLLVSIIKQCTAKGSPYDS